MSVARLLVEMAFLKLVNCNFSCCCSVLILSCRSLYVLELSSGVLMHGIQLIGPRVRWHFLNAQKASSARTTRAMQVASARMRYGTNVFLSRKAAEANSWAVS